MPSEKPLIAEIILEASRLGHRLFRNSNGQMEIDGRTVRYGVANPGGSDLIGWTKDGKFAAVEVKAGKTKTTPEQLAFCNAVRAAGGRAGIVRTLDEARAVLDGTSQA